MAGGGTGGHVYPAIAIADAIRRTEPESVVAFAGTTDRMEWDAVPKAGYPIHPIAAAGIRRSLSLGNLRVPLTMARGLAQSWHLVGDFDADAVVGTGGYVSGPVGLAAAMRRRALVVQEQNARPGVTNRILGRMADRIHVAFDEAESAFPPGRTRVSGNPIRRGLAAMGRDEARERYGIPADARVLLVLGGSLGSQAINEAVARHVGRLLESPDTAVIWQAGSRYVDRMAAAVPGHERLRLSAFIDRMDLAYAAADLVLCRSGAITCSELLATGRPSVLVPSPNVTEDHQTRNAESLVRVGAARLLPETGLAEGWEPLVRQLLDDPATLASMAGAARSHAVLDSADRIARDVLDLARHRAARAA
jgi:UDP-N-acetylglucosamine--N-acetylmuramyl-(pentapeptide) pyrophosphoryl-undecaprenol N-acetylglucosamine transferase